MLNNLFDEAQTPKPIAATYEYRDAVGQLRFQVLRYTPKGFKVRRPDGAGGWIGNLEGLEPLLYRLPEPQGQRGVCICEGEGKTDRLREAFS